MKVFLRPFPLLGILPHHTEKNPTICRFLVIETTFVWVFLSLPFSLKQTRYLLEGSTKLANADRKFDIPGYHKRGRERSQRKRSIRCATVLSISWPCKDIKNSFHSVLKRNEARYTELQTRESEKGYIKRRKFKECKRTKKPLRKICCRPEM